MQSFLFFVLALAVLGGCIWLLHRIQLRRTAENADLAAPLEALDASPLPDFATSAQPPPAASGDNWLALVRAFRESGQLGAALDLSKTHFPKAQAFQQAAIILRQQIRDGLEQFQPVDAPLKELFHTAALADLFRSSSSHKPLDPPVALAAVRNLSFHYAAIGHQRLKLLNKSDVRAFEQLWGSPAAHRHVEEVLGDDWLKWCRPPD